MPLYKTLQSFIIGQHELGLYVPSGAFNERSVHSPYWAKVWPAAIGLCEFLNSNLHFIKNKKVAELAAGLGLPSLFAAHYAETVFCTDIEPAAMELAQLSAAYNNLNNVHCTAAGWNDIDAALIPGTLLLSDVNYAPEQFDALLKVIEYYLQQGSTVILSSPQRLMAKPFIEKLLPYCKMQQEQLVKENGIETAVSVFVLAA